MDLRNRIYGDLDKKNEIPKVKLPKFATGGICNDAIFPKGDYISEFEKIAKDIRDRQDNAMAMEFTKDIGDLLKKNGVCPKFEEYSDRVMGETKIEMRYGVCLVDLDFSEHDKPFEDKIAALEERIQELDTVYAIRMDENRELKQRIAELESEKSENCEKETISDDSRPSAEWYENRYQQDCITINRLNTTIDVLIHKIEYLRQFAGLE